MVLLATVAWFVQTGGCGLPLTCHLEQRPTHLEALRELHQKLVREHGGATHCADPKAIARRAELQNMDDEHENTASGNAFDRMRAAASMQAVAAQRAAIDARELEQARAAEMKATLAREEAEARAKSSAATAAALAPQKASKKQKVASAHIDSEFPSIIDSQSFQAEEYLFPFKLSIDSISSDRGETKAKTACFDA